MLTAAATALILQYRAGSSGEIEITLGGETIYKGPGTSAETKYIDIEGAAGAVRVRIDVEGAAVESSDCPNRECVKMGYLKSKYLPIVCLPNRLVIRYTDADEDVDAVSK